MSLTSPVGRSLTRSQTVAMTSFALALAVTSADLMLMDDLGSRQLFRGWPAGLFLPVVALVGLGFLAGWDRETLGLRWRPVQGWAYWLKATLVISLVLGALFGAVLAYQLSTGEPSIARAIEPRLAWSWLGQAVLDAPVFEEGVYRLALCTGIVALIGTWPTVAVSGLVFGLLHVVYGNPAPENLVGGYILAWSYLHSGTILVPLAMHSLGNLGINGLAVLLWLLI